MNVESHMPPSPMGFCRDPTREGARALEPEHQATSLHRTPLDQQTADGRRLATGKQSLLQDTSPTGNGLVAFVESLAQTLKLGTACLCTRWLEQSRAQSIATESSMRQGSLT